MKSSFILLCYISLLFTACNKKKQSSEDEKNVTIAITHEVLMDEENNPIPKVLYTIPSRAF